MIDGLAVLHDTDHELFGKLIAFLIHVVVVKDIVDAVVEDRFSELDLPVIDARSSPSTFTVCAAPPPDQKVIRLHPANLDLEHSVSSRYAESADSELGTDHAQDALMAEGGSYTRTMSTSP
ncbi:hypothetical protein [Burkholderia sp. Ac-20353]|uniref:hypothetical protein n=1 Tax=Burkholderia sp. Ac-20353 TaxID=2703894 RepID=UPI00197BA178|nr:hypothetical protein [Burkholderia sp. Ac-20353]MBN3785754.1 hypothetical protein [Burkholderia sp. Ac-20353]